MLVDEAKLAVQLQHANIVQTFDLGRVDEQYYIAMELIDGVDLYKLLRRASERDIDFPFEVAAFIAPRSAPASITRTASATRAAGRCRSCIATSRRRTCSSASTAA